MSFASNAPKSSNAFILFAYDWDSFHGGERDCLQSFATLTEAEQAYQGVQDAAEVALFREGDLQVISRGFANRRVSPRQIQWSRAAEWAREMETDAPFPKNAR